MENDVEYLALHGVLSALIYSMYDAGTLDKDRFARHLTGAANHLEQEGIRDAAAKIFELRALFCAPQPVR
jgi:hypothetical protein